MSYAIWRMQVLSRLNASSTTPDAPTKPRTGYRIGHRQFSPDEVEHIVTPDDPDTALCGVDQTDVPWNTGWPWCEACVAIQQGRMN